ncbi:MAG: DUF2800 domain-containing protein [Prolixibacteraceae bacterium]
MPGEHAVLSPSGASRWLACTPSARLEMQYPDTSGAAAAEGTVAHALGEAIIRRHVFSGAERVKANAEIMRIEKDPYYCEDMQAHCEDYATFVIELFEEAKTRNSDAVIKVEQKLDLTDYVPEGFGTGDCIIIADGTLYIIDLKYGKGVLVSCENNKQMMLYALGALREFDFLYDIHAVSMTIYQPRLNNISTFEMPVRMLHKWAEDELVPRSKMAFEGVGEFAPGKHCQFCKARVQCKALAEYNLELAKYEFQKANLLEDADIADIMDRASMFTSWLNSIQEYALKEAVDNGKKWPGYKLVEGRSNRCYKDQDLVVKTLKDAGYPEDLLYTRSLLGITAMEKTITAKQFSVLLGDLVIKPAGKPTLVPATDKRPEWNSVESAVKDFSEVS